MLSESDIGTFLSLVHKKFLNSFVQVVRHRFYTFLVNLKHEVDSLFLCFFYYFFTRWIKLDTFCTLLDRSKHQYSKKHNQDYVKLFWQTHPENISIPDCSDCRCDEIKRCYVESLV